MPDNQQTALQAVSAFKASLETEAQHYISEISKENENISRGGIKGLVTFFSPKFLSDPFVLLHNFNYHAAADLTRVEDLIKQKAPDNVVISELQHLKTQFDENAQYLKKRHFNPVKRAKRSAEFKSHSKKVDEIIKLI